MDFTDSFKAVNRTKFEPTLSIVWSRCDSSAYET